MKKSTKHATVTPINMVLNGGLNYSQDPTNIADNELQRANNFIYDPETDRLVTRPGTSCQTNSLCDGTNPIIAIYYYEKSSTEAYLVGACNGNLYYLSNVEEYGNLLGEDGAYLKGEDGTYLTDETQSLAYNTWVLIGSLNDTTTVPSFLTFNTKLLIADGGTLIKTWDGDSFGSIATSPAATALNIIKNRVVCNAKDEPDSVYLSAPNDETGWDTSSTAIGLKAGYGDNMTVVNFGVYGDDLAIFKKGDALKKIYRLNVSDADTDSWYIKDLSANNSTQNAQSVVESWNNIFFVDSNGFKSIKGTDTYGDVAVDIQGRKINNLFVTQPHCDFMSYIPLYNAIWFGMGDRIFTYHEMRTDDGTVTPAFTDLLFKQGRIRAMCQAATTVYMAGQDGYLYRLDESKSTDATAPTTNVSFPSTLRTKTMSFFSQGILRKIQWYLRPKLVGTAALVVYPTESTGIALKTVTLPSDGTYLADATGYLYDAIGYLYDEGANSWAETSRNRVRASEMAFELLVTSGRVGVEWVRAEIAQVEG